MSERQIKKDIKQLRKEFEELKKQSAGDLSDEQLKTLEKQKIIHELKVHQIELEMQNQMLRETQLNLEKSNEHYQKLFDLSPEGLALIDSSAIIRRANSSLMKMVGENIINKPFVSLVNDEDSSIFNARFRAYFKNPDEKEMVLRLWDSDKKEFLYARLTGTVMAQGEDLKEQMLLLSVSDITELKKNELEVEKLLEEKELLLKEVHHRIKNNMFTIEALLNQHVMDSDNDEVKNAIQNAAGRVSSMRVLYQKLFSSNDYFGVEADTYFSSLVDEIIYVFSNNDVTIDKDFDKISIEPRVLFPLGIIINELVTNAMKYAFSSQEQPRILVSFKRIDDQIRFTIKDNGKGFDWGKTKEGSFGLKLVELLVQQIKGELEINNNEGTEVVITFNY